MPRIRPRVAAATMLVGIVVAAICIAGLATRHGRALPADFGDPAPSSVKQSPVAPTPAASTHRPRSVPPAPPPDLSGPPVSVSLPAFGVRATVTPVIAADHELRVPHDPAELGWWIGSAPIGGASGSTVIDGHVDSAATGAGALYRLGLGQVRPGDEITATTAGGLTVVYRVYAQHVYVKAQGLPADVFAVAGPARLVLITCGGPFDQAAKSYDDNILVYARPVG